MTLLISQSNLLSNKKEILIQDLATERLLLTETNCPYRQVFEQAIQSRGVNPYSGLEIMSLRALQSMVQSGLGIGVMPTAIVNPAPENTVLKNIQNLKLELPVGIAILPEKTVPGLALNLILKTLQDGLKNSIG